MLKSKKSVRNVSVEITKLKNAREDAKAKDDLKLYNELTRKIDELDEIGTHHTQRPAPSTLVQGVVCFAESGFGFAVCHTPTHRVGSDAASVGDEH